eukprot:jgi/Undpi1/10099/HiC_scaffold_28.g12553.m1
MALRAPCRQLAKALGPFSARTTRRWQPAAFTSGYHVCTVVAIPSATHIVPASSPSYETSPIVAASGQRRLKHGSKKDSTARTAAAMQLVVAPKLTPPWYQASGLRSLAFRRAFRHLGLSLSGFGVDTHASRAVSRSAWTPRHVLCHPLGIVHVALLFLLEEASGLRSLAFRRAFRHLVLSLSGFGGDTRLTRSIQDAARQASYSAATAQRKAEVSKCTAEGETSEARGLLEEEKKSRVNDAKRVTKASARSAWTPRHVLCHPLGIVHVARFFLFEEASGLRSLAFRRAFRHLVLSLSGFGGDTRLTRSIQDAARQASYSAATAQRKAEVSKCTAEGETSEARGLLEEEKKSRVNDAKRVTKASARSAWTPRHVLCHPLGVVHVALLFLLEEASGLRSLAFRRAFRHLVLSLSGFGGDTRLTRSIQDAARQASYSAATAQRKAEVSKCTAEGETSEARGLLEEEKKSRVNDAKRVAKASARSAWTPRHVLCHPLGIVHVARFFLFEEASGLRSLAFRRAFRHLVLSLSGFGGDTRLTRSIQDAARQASYSAATAQRKAEVSKCTAEGETSEARGLLEEEKKSLVNDAKRVAKSCARSAWTPRHVLCHPLGVVHVALLFLLEEASGLRSLAFRRAFRHLVLSLSGFGGDTRLTRSIQDAARQASYSAATAQRKAEVSKCTAEGETSEARGLLEEEKKSRVNDVKRVAKASARSAWTPRHVLCHPLGIVHAARFFLFEEASGLRSLAFRRAFRHLVLSLSGFGGDTRLTRSIQDAARQASYSAATAQRKAEVSKCTAEGETSEARGLLEEEKKSRVNDAKRVTKASARSAWTPRHVLCHPLGIVHAARFFLFEEASGLRSLAFRRAFRHLVLSLSGFGGDTRLTRSIQDAARQASYSAATAQRKAEVSKCTAEGETSEARGLLEEEKKSRVNDAKRVTKASARSAWTPRHVLCHPLGIVHAARFFLFEEASGLRSLAFRRAFRHLVLSLSGFGGDTRLTRSIQDAARQASYSAATAQRKAEVSKCTAEGETSEARGLLEEEKKSRVNDAKRVTKASARPLASATLPSAVHSATPAFR